MRINRYIAQTGDIARRKADDLVRAGRVHINDKVATLGAEVQPGDKVKVDGRLITPQAPVYLALYKPRNMVTTLADPQGRSTIRDLIPPRYEGVFPVGRLDFDAFGLLLLTNDGQLAQALHHPTHGVPKTYIVRLNPWVNDEALARMAHGLVLDGKPLRQAEIRRLGSDHGTTTVEIILRQGLKNQIKRMAAAVDSKAVSIKRVAVGPVRLKGMNPGEIRRLTPAEVKRLRQTMKSHENS